MKDLTELENLNVDLFTFLPKMEQGEAHHQVHAGPGACNSCGCRGFRSTPKKDDICGDCGHYWQVHSKY